MYFLTHASAKKKKKLLNAALVKKNIPIAHTKSDFELLVLYLVSVSMKFGYVTIAHRYIFI